jgi:hypothetical protein
VREAVEKIRARADNLYPGDGGCGPTIFGRSYLNKSILDALLACDEANERAEAAGAEWAKARDAWRIRRSGAGTAVQVSDACDNLDAYFAIRNTDTNRVCPTCLHQYNDRVEHVCNDD